MCYAIPGRIVSISGNTAILDYFGEKRKAGIIGMQDTESKTGNPKLETGNYVYAQGGIIVDTISEQEALPVLEAWRERFIELRKIDESLKAGGAKGELAPIIGKAENGALLTFREMKKILDTDDSKELESLFENANRIRSKNIQNACCVHGIIEFSNHCVNECAYCGINESNSKLKRYRMSADEIVDRSVFCVKSLGFKALVIQSGEDPFFTDQMLVDIVKRIRGQCGVLLFVSIGERSFDCYKSLYEAGAYGALVRFETSNPKLYTLMRPGKKLEHRLALIRRLKAHGFILATGFIIGLPGQAQQDLINDILLTKSLKPDMFSFGPLIPHPCTLLANAEKVTMDYALKIIALSRIVAPGSHILVTTALETLDPDGKRKGLLAGANSLMINATPEKYRENYDIYPSKTRDSGLETTEVIQETLSLLYSLGRAPTDLGL